VRNGRNANCSEIILAARRGGKRRCRPGEVAGKPGRAGEAAAAGRTGGRARGGHWRPGPAGGRARRAGEAAGRGGRGGRARRRRRWSAGRPGRVGEAAGSGGGAAGRARGGRAGDAAQIWFAPNSRRAGWARGLIPLIFGGQTQTAENYDQISASAVIFGG